ncbi:efflux RND transporter periplasmic adaptor subunit [Pseudomonas benzenivorans]|uniref:Efflux RND transporter periplasmic adaptor subunit n=1 Tax=Pseudomonas benzenivorans TaxID=556533 RepID=A0ABZ0PQZ4_9PSED|nr:efflux RND transporter periplasmic adaptor subunit [Pseudomonas benzenivorans]WPC03573.1 efflux RND transporter periplasmic adaptor subunit [Pseudomonas benzenivorans]
MPAHTCRFLVAIVLSLAAVVGSAENGQGPLVEVVRPERGLVRDELITFGSLRSAESLMIRPEIDGRLARLHFQEGQAVSAGDLLVSLDDAVARAELALARANLDLAASNLRRSQLLFQRGASNAQALDEARAEAQARRASLALARARLDKTQIRAPYDGLLGLRQVSPGDYLEAGQDIVNLEVLDPLKLDFRVPQKAVGQVRPGQVVEIRLDAFADEVFHGRISAINPQLDVAGRSQAIRAQLSNPGLRLKPGQFVRVTVILAERPQALLIPEEAVMPLGERLLVNLVVDGKVEQREIRLGRRLGGRAEVREGLSGDETLISAGWHKVRPGMAVRTRPAGAGA